MNGFVKTGTIYGACAMAVLAAGLAFSSAAGFAQQPQRPDVKGLVRQAVEKSREDSSRLHPLLKPLVETYGSEAALAACDAFRAEPKGRFKNALGHALTFFPDPAVDGLMTSLFREDLETAGSCNALGYLEERFPELAPERRSEALDAFVGYMSQPEGPERVALVVGAHGRATDIPALRAAWARCQKPAPEEWERVNWMGDTRSDWCLVAMALARLGDQEALDRIALATESKLPGERAWAAKALAYVGSPLYLPLFAPMVKDDTPVEEYVLEFIGTDSGGHSDNALDLVAARCIFQIADPKPAWSFLVKGASVPVAVPAMGKHRLDGTKDRYSYSCYTLSPAQRKEILAWLDGACSAGGASGESHTALRAEVLLTAARARLSEGEAKSARAENARLKEKSLRMSAKLLLSEPRRSPTAEALANEDFAAAERAFKALGPEAALKFYLLRLAYGTLDESGAASLARYPAEAIVKTARATFWPVLLDSCTDSREVPAWDLCESLKGCTAHEVLHVYGREGHPEPYVIESWKRRVYLFESESGFECGKACYYQQGESVYRFDWDPEGKEFGVEVDDSYSCWRGVAGRAPEGVRLPLLKMSRANLIHWEGNMAAPPGWSKSFLPEGDLKCLQDFSKPFSPNDQGEQDPVPLP